MENERGTGTGSRRGGSESTRGGKALAVPAKGKKGKAAAAAAAAAANEEGSTGGKGSSASSKPKHPNQYTYRNKDRLGAISGQDSSFSGSNSNDPSSNLTGFPTPSPSKGGRGRNAASTSRTGTPIPSEAARLAVPSHPGSAWGMPEHLSHLSNLLSSPNPENLTLNFPSTKGLPRTLVASAAASAAAKEREREKLGKEEITLENGEKVWRRRYRDKASPQPFQTISVVENNTKIRFPPKRMTLGEMRKRVRNIGEYVTRTQVEAVERGRRRSRLGIDMHTLNEIKRKEDEKNGKKKKKSSAKKGKEKEVEGDNSNENGESILTDQVKGDDTAKSQDVEMKDATQVETTVTSQDQSNSEVKDSTDLNSSNEERKAAEIVTENDESKKETSVTKPSEEIVKPTEDQDDEEVDEDEEEQVEEDPTIITMRLVEELTKELIAFQQKFGSNVPLPVAPTPVVAPSNVESTPVQSTTEITGSTSNLEATVVEGQPSSVTA